MVYNSKMNGGAKKHVEKYVETREISFWTKLSTISNTLSE